MRIENEPWQTHLRAGRFLKTLKLENQKTYQSNQFNLRSIKQRGKRKEVTKRKDFTTQRKREQEELRIRLRDQRHLITLKLENLKTYQSNQFNQFNLRSSALLSAHICGKPKSSTPFFTPEAPPDHPGHGESQSFAQRHTAIFPHKGQWDQAPRRMIAPTPKTTCSGSNTRIPMFIAEG